MAKISGCYTSNPTSEVNSVTDSKDTVNIRIESRNGEKGETAHTRVKELVEEEMQEHTEITSFDYRQISKDQPNDSLQNERSGSQFSFTEIKRKLKNAIGRSKRDSRCLEKSVVDGSNGRSPPIRDQFYSERFSRISDGFKIQVGAPRSFNFDAKSRENDGFGDRSD
ncbi:hypothetical protein LXL04_008297 [Taraxacum kok-saghyz]